MRAPAPGFDFAPPRRGLPDGALLMLTGVVLCGLAWHGWQQHRQDLAQAAKTMQAREARADAKLARTPAKDDARIPAIERRLNLPWGQILSGIDRAVPPQVVLLSVEPDADKGRVEIAAEARDPVAMTGFVAALGQDKAFSQAVLLTHQVRAEDANRPLRFTVSAQWRSNP